MQADIAKLRELLADWRDSAEYTGYSHYHREAYKECADALEASGLLALAEGAEADRADARRYRWLRDNDQDSYVVLRDHDFLKYGIHLDAAIDAALAGAVTQGEG